MILVMCCISLQCIGAGWRLKSKSAKLPRRSSVNYMFSRALERAQHKYVVTHNLRGKVTVRETLKRTEPARPLKLRSKGEMIATSKALYAKIEGLAPYELTERDTQIRCQASVLEKLSMGYDKLEVSHIKEMILYYAALGKKERTMQYIAEAMEWIINAREDLPVDE